MKQLRILRSASRDLTDGFIFYEKQETGLGDFFLASIVRQIEQLKTTAGTHPVDYDDYLRMVCRKFPYAVYYLTDEKFVTIYAVVDCRRDLNWIHSHLDES